MSEKLYSPDSVSVEDDHVGYSVSSKMGGTRQLGVSVPEGTKM